VKLIVKKHNEKFSVLYTASANVTYHITGDSDN